VNRSGAFLGSHHVTLDCCQQAPCHQYLVLLSLQVCELLRSPISSCVTCEAAASRYDSNTLGPADLPAGLCDIARKDFFFFQIYLHVLIM